MAKLPRPGVSGIAGVPPVGGCLVVEGFSREANAAGVETTGLTGFFECAVTKRIVLWAQPTHFLVRSGATGWGDIAFGPKVLLNHETAHVPCSPSATATSSRPPPTTWAPASATTKSPSTPTRSFTARPASPATLPSGRLPRHLRPPVPGVPRRRHPHPRQTRLRLPDVLRHLVLNNYGGAVAAAVYSLRPTFAIQAGVEHGFGPRSADFGVILGFNYLYRPRPR